mmetsp:Transcript_7208/g.17285  ORF Transcript_7208/g.17285 Transcript_7208/m.17285 type:complete len:254 (-) Transcript_7208:379-1140(-)
MAPARSVGSLPLHDDRFQNIHVWGPAVQRVHPSSHKRRVPPGPRGRETLVAVPQRLHAPSREMPVWTGPKPAPGAGHRLAHWRPGLGFRRVDRNGGCPLQRSLRRGPGVEEPSLAAHGRQRGCPGEGLGFLSMHCGQPQGRAPVRDTLRRDAAPRVPRAQHRVVRDSRWEAGEARRQSKRHQVTKHGIKLQESSGKQSPMDPQLVPRAPSARSCRLPGNLVGRYNPTRRFHRKARPSAGWQQRGRAGRDGTGD